MKTYTLIITILGVPLLCLGQFMFADRCDTAPDINGCSIPGNLPYFFSEVFRSDCNKHDVCYSCGHMHDVSRRGCDNRFYENIKQTCRTDSRVSSRTWCRLITVDYYLAVRIGGSGNYRTMSPGWCSGSWVPQCLRGGFFWFSPFPFFGKK